MQNVLLDSDCGFDDLLALCILAGSKSVRLKSVTTVHGMTSPGVGATTMRRILDKLGCSAPVVAGAPQPRPGGHLLNEVDWGRCIQAYSSDSTDCCHRSYIASYPSLVESLRLPLPSCRIPDGSAESAGNAILAAAKENQGCTLVCLGPLTNVAAALQLEPGALGSLVSRVVVMGGAVRVPGNMGQNNEAELNLYSDPNAAAHVLHSGLHIELLDLDVTGPGVFGDDNNISVLQRLCALEGTSAASGLTKALLENDLELGLKGEAALASLYDPVAACFAVESGLFESEQVLLRVNSENGATTEVTDQAAESVAVTLPTRFAQAGGYEKALADLITQS